MPDPKTVFDNAGIVLAAVLDAKTEAEVTQITAIRTKLQPRRRSMPCGHALKPSWKLTATARR